MEGLHLELALKVDVLRQELDSFRSSERGDISSLPVSYDESPPRIDAQLPTIPSSLQEELYGARGVSGAVESRIPVPDPQGWYYRDDDDLSTVCRTPAFLLRYAH